MDVQAAYESFEGHREGKGDEFLSQVRHLEVLLAQNPEMGFNVGKGIRKLLMPRFDHGVFYSFEGRRIMVAAVLDLRRDPNYVRSRIGLES
jgi:hypothetical protein